MPPISLRRRARRVFRGLLLGLVLAAAAARDAHAIKLSAAIPADYQIDGYALTPDGQTVVYALADEGSGNVLRLVAVPIAGGGATTLVDIPVTGSQGSVDVWEITPDGTGVVFLSDKDAQRFRNDLFRVPIDGSTGPLKLNTAPAPNDVDTLRVAGDSTRVVFEVFATRKIYSVPTTGGMPVELGTGTGSFLPRYQISPDSMRVVFPFDDGMGGGRQIYSVPIDGSQLPLKLTAQPVVLLPGESSAAPTFTPDGTKVLFFSRPDAMKPAEYEFWVTPVAQAMPTKLAGPLAIYFPDLRVTPDGTRAVFTAGTFPAYRLYRVPLDGSTSEQPVSGVGQNVVVSDYATSPSGQSFAYRVFGSGKYRLFTVSLAGGDDTELTPAVLPGIGAWDHFAFDAASARVVFAAERETAGVIELYSIAKGGGPTVKLSKHPMPATGDVDPASITLSPDGFTVVYLADQDTDGVNELFSAGLASGGPQKVHPNLAPNGDVARGAVVSSDSQTIVYLADQETNDVLELFATDDPAPAPTPTGATPTATPGGNATPTVTVSATRTPTPLATRTPVPEAPDRCADCIDNDFDGAVDRVDPDCPPYADGGGAGLAGDVAKAALKCQKTLAKVGTDVALKRVKALSSCLQKAFACVQSGSEPTCQVKAGAACGKAESARQATITKARAAVAKSCGDPPLLAADLGAAAGLGFASEDARCADFGASVADVTAVASCLVAHHACRAEALVGTQVPRARALLVATGRDPTLEAPCLPDGGAGGALSDAPTVVTCQKALAKAGATYSAARLKAGQKCADGVLKCVQLKANAAACRTKAEAKCATLAAKVAGAVTKLHAALAKGCAAPEQLASASGVGFDARSAECAALGAPAGSLEGIASCVVAQHDCRVDQLLIGQTPRGEELGALLP